EEVDRRGDRLEVAVAYLRHDLGPGFDHVHGIGTTEDRIEEPAVVQAVHPARRVDVTLRFADRIRVVEIERDADLGVGREAAQDLDGTTMREQEMMRGGERVSVGGAPRR